MARTLEEPSSPSTTRARGQSAWAWEGSRGSWDADDVSGQLHLPLYFGEVLECFLVPINRDGKGELLKQTFSVYKSWRTFP